MSSTLQHLQQVSAKSWLPTFLCPLLTLTRIPLARLPRQTSPLPLRASPRRRLHLDLSQGLHDVSILPQRTSGLPRNCPGCGAYSQTSNAEEAGYYTSSRKAVKSFLARRNGTIDARHAEELAIFDQAVRSMDGKMAEELGLAAQPPPTSAQTEDTSIPICNRCHDLLHHSKGASIVHPSMESIREFIHESPHKYNHIYHVVDAADFPLSVVPKLHKYLSLMPQRSRNRRAKTERFYQDRKMEMSFIITRSDLLAPTKELVDRLMPFLVSVLREALGKASANVRLGNVRCVSSQRGWWTRQVKEEIWQRGGGGWLVGKANVGKSSLFESVFPKGRYQSIDFQSLRQAALQGGSEALDRSSVPDGLSAPDEYSALDDRSAADGLSEPHELETSPVLSALDKSLAADELSSDELSAPEILPSSSEPAISEQLPPPPDGYSVQDGPPAPGAAEELTKMKHSKSANQLSGAEADSNPLADANLLDLQDRMLLPPVPAETQYPVMPIISDVSGTTASPIRLLFGNSRGELVDLPGLARGKLEDAIKDDVKKSLLMRDRIKPKQISIKPGQSMLIGNHLRITPVWPNDTVFLAYPFLSIDGHVCHTAKAADLQTQVRHSPAADTLKPGAGATIKSAGIFDLATDVTHQRTGPLTADNAIGLQVDALPFRIFSVDILVEGCGWIELVAQVRRRALEQAERDADDRQRCVPAVEIFTPDGKGVGARRPMGAWMLGGFHKRPKTARPRRSMKGAKKERKRLLASGRGV